MKPRARWRMRQQRCEKRREEAFGNEGDLETWIRTEERNPGYMGVKYGLGSNTRYLQANDRRPTDIGGLFRKPWNHPH